MIIITMLTLLLLIGVALIILDNKYNFDYDLGGWGTMCVIVFGAILFCSVICIPIARETTIKNIIKFEAVRETINEARKSSNQLESTAIQIEIIKHNQWLAATKYYNKFLFDLWVPDEIDTVESIK